MCIGLVFSNDSPSLFSSFEMLRHEFCVLINNLKGFFEKKHSRPMGFLFYFSEFVYIGYISIF